MKSTSYLIIIHENIPVNNNSKLKGSKGTISKWLVDSIKFNFFLNQRNLNLPISNNSQPKLEQEYWWDVARVTSRDFELEQMQLKSRAEIFKAIFKIIAYLCFFLVVLGSSVVSKLSLFTIVNSFKKDNQVIMNL